MMDMNSREIRPVGWILLHDLGYTAQSLAPLESALTEKGCRVVVPKLPGDGELPSAWSGISGSDMIRAVRDAVLGLMSDCGEVCIFGHGTGALLALQMAEELPVKGLLLAAPTLRLPDRFVLFSRLIARFAPYQPHGDKRGDLPEDGRDKGLPTAAFPVVLDLARRIQADIGSVTCPVRIIVAGQDQWSDPPAAAELAEQLLRAKALVIPEAAHQCLTGEGGAQIMELAGRFTAWAGKEKKE